MRFLRLAPIAAVMSVSAPALAQHDHGSTPAAASDAQRSFEALKALAGTWEGTLTATPAVEGFVGAQVKVVIRVTSRGNAVMHEMTIAGLPDNPITMIHLDGDRLILTHYCDSGNRPRMVGTLSADGQTVAFRVLDISGSTQHGHMADAVFTITDANHHVEQWASIYPNGKSTTGHFDLRRTKEASGPFGQ